MKKATLKIAILTAAFLLFYASNAKALEKFNLNSITASEFSGKSDKSGIFNFFRRDDTEESIPEPEPKPEVKPQPERDWTIMVYINAKNDLEKYGLKDINEMEMIGSSNEINVVVEIGRMNGYDSSEGDWTGSRRYLIQKDDSTSAITSPVLADLGKVDMGDWKHLVDFGVWAKTKYPAKKYMLIVWNHGTGWKKDVKAVKNKGLSFDFETKNHFTTPELAKALKEIGKLDVYASDACFMQMVSVDYEIKDDITYIVGSEAMEPKDGYTYNTMLKPIISNPKITPYQAAKVLVDAFCEHYQSIGESSTQSFIRTSALDKLLVLMNDWAYAAIQAREKALILKYLYKTQRYVMFNNSDLYHFVSLITAETMNADVKEKGEALMNHIEKRVVCYSRYTHFPTDWNYSNSRGIAVYLPILHYNSNYEELKIFQNSHWDRFVKLYLQF